MRIDTNNLQRAYSINGLSGGIKPANMVKPASNADDSSPQSLSTLKRSKIITGAERQFFANLFPDNSKQMMTHDVFTRSGKLQSGVIEKGAFIDGRI
jgi:hypothetical protein